MCTGFFGSFIYNEVSHHSIWDSLGIFHLIAAVILPTAWLYLKNRFQAEPISLGLLLSAFSFSGLIASPIIGK